MELQGEAFVAEVAKLIPTLLDESGAVLYSALTTLRPGPFYFVGLNPGGINGKSIRESLNSLIASDTNAYLDEDWSPDRRNYGTGGHPLQRRAKALFEALGCDIRSVCAANLIFRRSKGERELDLELGEVCWPVHALVLNIVRPRSIIAFGRHTFAFLAEKLGPGAAIEIDSGHANWNCRVHYAGERVLVGLPHLSRYSITSHASTLSRVCQVLSTSSA